MSTKLHTAFKSIRKEGPSAELTGLILDRVAKMSAKKARRNYFFARAGVWISMVALVGFSFTAGSAIVDSEFFDLAKLAFSDASVVLQNWREYSYSLLETMPVTNITMLLSPIFTLLVSYAVAKSLQDKINHKVKYNFGIFV